MEILSVILIIGLLLCIVVALGGIVLIALSKSHTTANTLGILITAIGILGGVSSFVLLSVTDFAEDHFRFPDIFTKPQASEVIDVIPDSNDPYALYPAGTYRVGKDIPAGEYCLYALNEYATVSISENDEIDYGRIAFFTTHQFVTVTDGEYLIVEDAEFTLADYITPFCAQPDGSYTEGGYRIGIDMPAGEYYITSEDIGTAHIASSGNLTYEDTVYSIGVGTFIYITVRDGDYLSLERASAIDAADAPLAAPLAAGSYGVGMYRVGIVIPEGIYYITSDEESCYYEVYQELRDYCYFNDFFENFTFVKLEAGDYFLLDRGTFRAEQDIPKIGPNGDRYDSGTYRVGVDIPAGTYRIYADKLTDAATVGITDEPRGSRTDYDEYEYFYGNITVTVENGDYLEVRGASFAAE